MEMKSDCLVAVDGKKRTVSQGVTTVIRMSLEESHVVKVDGPPEVWLNHQLRLNVPGKQTQPLH